jgi:hypothetical protein
VKADHPPRERLMKTHATEGTRAFITRMRGESAWLLQRFLENELSIISSFIAVSQGHYERGSLHNAERAKGEAAKGIQTVRHFLYTSGSLSPAVMQVLSDRCAELEQDFARLTAVGRGPSSQK